MLSARAAPAPLAALGPLLPSRAAAAGDAATSAKLTSAGAGRRVPARTCTRLRQRLVSEGGSSPRCSTWPPVGGRAGLKATDASAQVRLATVRERRQVKAVKDSGSSSVSCGEGMVI